METKESVEKKQVREPRTGKKQRRYRFEEKLKAVRLHLQEGFEQELVCQETGVSQSTLSTWLRAYREQGEAGLQGRTAPRPGRRRPAAITEKILQLKRANRWYGVKKIAQALRRLFLLPASPETVRRRLHEAGLMDKPAKGRRNLTRPRFFERATPNQMWQSDLFTFRLGGKYAYVVAFMDDYSRYIVGLDLYRSPTAEAVIETYRVAVGEYSPPKEMLTDRGRQYTNWRGKSRFAVELQKDRVAHFVSRPQHPMTLGKVERFWASMWQEFLVRAQFDSFESARERLRLWVKYYNHRRPHQGIGGLCPADRYFEIASELKQTLQTGIQENLLELALRGQPKSPFYLVGRMDGQSVVLQAEKGKLKLRVDEKEMTYDLEKGTNGGEGNGAAQAPGGDKPEWAHRGGEDAGGAGGVDGAGETGDGDEESGDQLSHAPAVAGPGDGGDAAGLGEPGEPGGWGGLEPAPQIAPAEAPDGDRPGETERPAGAHPGDCAHGRDGVKWLNHGRETQGAVARGSDHESAGGPDDREGGGRPVGRLAQNLLRVGSAGLGRDVGEPGGPAGGQSAEPGVAGAGGPAGESGETGAGTGGRETDGGDPGRAPGDGAGRG
jgi:transposase InsO family protein